MLVIKIIVLFTIGTIPLLFAAVQPWMWSFYSLCMIVVFIIHLWQGKRGLLFCASGIYLTLAVGLFFAVTLLLCLPFPPSLLPFLSPMRFEVLTSAGKLVGGFPEWQTLSYSSKNALAWWIFLLSLSLFFIVVQNFCVERKGLRIVVFVMLGVGLVEAVYGLIQALIPSMGVLWVDYILAYRGDARGTFINRNHFAGFIEMVWPLALGCLLAQAGRAHTFKKALASDRLNLQALMALGIVVLLLSLLFSRSRAGIAGGFIGFLTFLVMARTGIKGIGLHSRLLLGGIIVLLGIYCMAIGVGPILERFLSIGDGNSRMDFWRDSLPILIDHPLGIGLRNYETVFQIYNQAIIPEKTVTYAHNDFLQLMIESGWIGSIALASGFFVFLGSRARQIKRLDARRDPLRFYLAVGAFSGLISMTLHSFFDFNLQIPANCVYFVVLMAILDACTWRRQSSPNLINPQTKTKQKGVE